MTDETTDETSFVPKTVFELMGVVQQKMSEKGVAMTETNQQQNYSYRGIKNFLDVMSPVLAEAGLLISPTRVHDFVEQVRATRNGGTMYAVTLMVEFTLTSAVDGSQHIVRTIGQGMDSGDKSAAKAMTAAYKTMLIQTFAIPMEGTPEAEDGSPEGVFTPIPEAQLDEIKGLATRTETGEQQFCQWLSQVDTFAELDVSVAPRALSALNKKLEVLEAANASQSEDNR